MNIGLALLEAESLVLPNCYGLRTNCDDTAASKLVTTAAATLAYPTNFSTATVDEPSVRSFITNAPGSTDTLAWQQQLLPGWHLTPLENTAAEPCWEPQLHHSECGVSVFSQEQRERGMPPVLQWK